MKRILKSALPVALALVTSAALAGGPECQKKDAQMAKHEHKCSMSAEGCKKEMAEARHRGWIGLDLDQNESGAMFVKSVVPDSPAQAAGFQAGDVLVSLNGVALNEKNEEKIHEVRKGLKVGDSVTYTVKRGDSETSLTAKLAKMPETVYQAMVTEHMKEHTDVAAR